MFCYQCEQTAKGEGCTVRGIGKKPEVAALQDLMIYGLSGAFHGGERRAKSRRQGQGSQCLHRRRRRFRR